MPRYELASVFDKLDGAHKQLGALKEATGKRAVTDLVTLFADRDRQGRVRVRIKDVGEIPPEWFVRIGECLYDMRSALDHLAYALNIVGSEADPPPNWESSQFPLYTNRGKFRAMSRKPPDKCQIGHFPRGARTLVERLQPYRRWHDADAWRLGELVALSNIDKHRRVPITAATSSILIYPQPGEIEGHPITATWSSYRRLKPNATIMWFEVPTLPPSAKQPKVNYGFGADIEFEGKAGNPPVPLLMPHEGVSYVLGSILSVIRNRVVPDFEHFFA